MQHQQGYFIVLESEILSVTIEIPIYGKVYHCIVSVDVVLHPIYALERVGPQFVFVCATISKKNSFIWYVASLVLASPACKAPHFLFTHSLTQLLT